MPSKKNNSKSFRKSKLPLSKAQYKAVQKATTKALMKQSETKFKATELDAQPIGPDDACYIFDSLSSIAQGIDNEQRIGDRIIGTGIQLKYMFECTSANPINYLVRMMLISCREGEFGATTDNFLVNASNEPLAPVANDNMDVVRSLNRKEYKVLLDRNFSISSQTTSTGNGVGVRYGTKFFKFKHNRAFKQDANSTSEDDNLRLIIIVRDVGGGAVSAGNDIALTVNARYYYKDF